MITVWSRHLHKLFLSQMNSGEEKLKLPSKDGGFNPPKVMGWPRPLKAGMHKETKNPLQEAIP